MMDEGSFSRDEMEAEFGEPGVENPNILDLVTPDPNAKRVFLVMVEKRGWGSMVQLRQLEEKINRYLGYALDGFLAEQYPQYREHQAVLRLDCAEKPYGDAAAFLEEARVAVEHAGLEFEVRPATTGRSDS